MFLNHITPTEEEMEIGEDARGQVLAFANQLYPIQILHRRNPRVAQSIITRSELELFGWSTPRFAFRFAAVPDAPFFVNARRLGVLRGQRPGFIKRRETPNQLKALDYNSDYRRSPAELLLKQSPIADCFLGKTGAVESYHVIQVPLAAAYGETHDFHESRKPEQWGTPYMQHINLVGGGLCAQAVCFMASALLQDYATGVYGLAEITHLATNYEPATESFLKDEISLSGLHLTDVVRYFNAIGLRGTWQATLSELKLPARIAEGSFKEASARGKLHYEQAMRAYLLSNMPIVLLVDCGLMADKIYDNNPRPKLAREIQLEQGREYRHAILLVGAEKRDIDTSSSSLPRGLCFNDPVWMPFMTASAQELNKSAAKSRGSNSVRTEYHFMAVTPKEVRLSLGNAMSLEQLETVRPDGYRHEDHVFNPNQYLPGLREGLLNRQDRDELESDNHQLEYMRLLQVKDFENVVSAMTVPESWRNGEWDRKAILLRSIPTLTPLLHGLPREEDNWIWVQFLRDRIYIWNAEIESPAKAFYTFLRFGCDAWRPDRMPSLKSKEPSNEFLPPSSETNPIELEPALISSFCVNGLADGLKTLVESRFDFSRCRHIELYAFMQKDADHYLKKHLPDASEFLSAVQQMAQLYENTEAIRLIALELIEDITLGDLKLKFASLATFISELSANPLRGKEVKNARKAMAFLVRLARVLQSEGHPLRTIEIVAGSLVDGVWPAYDNEDLSSANTFGASLRSEKKAMQALIKRLRFVANMIKATEIDERGEVAPHLSLALELEPGPLYLLGTLKRLITFADLVSRDPILAPVVGLNLDIPHWFLAKIRPETIPLEVLFRICHVHISDHAKGHFSDGVLLSLNEAAVFEPWFTLLKRRVREVPPKGFVGPAFSGFISVEHEACKSCVMLETTLENLGRFVAKPGKY